MSPGQTSWDWPAGKPAVGPGSISRFDIGLVIATGLTIGALFSLYVVPVIYTYVASARGKITRQPEHAVSGIAAE